MQNAPSPAHCQPVVIGATTYRYDSPLAYGINEPKLFVDESDDTKLVVVKHFRDAEMSRVAMGAFGIWKRVRDILVPAGFPDIIDVTSDRQVNEYLPGLSLGLVPDLDIITTIDLLRSYLSSVSHHLDLLAENELQHGDVKIGNLLVRQGLVTPLPASSMLIDFDFLHSIGTCTPNHVGTLICTPPEFFREHISHRTRDIFSLGFASIHMLMGECDRFKFHEQPWAYGYIHGDYNGITYYRTKNGVPLRIIEKIEHHMRNILLPEATGREKELEQILGFISASIQNDIPSRPQNGREVRKMIGL